MVNKKVKVIPKTKPDIRSNNDEMKQAIIAAYFEVQDIKTKNKQKEKQKWREKVFGPEKAEPKSKIFCHLTNAWSDIKIFSKLMFIKKEDVLEGLGTESLLKLTLTFVFFILRWSLYLFACYLVYYSFANTAFWCLAIALLCFVIARIIRIASIEIENMKDRDYLIAIFSCVMSFSAMIIAIIALLNE